MEGAEEIGSVVTGALAARAVEPAAGEAGAEGGAACLNCGTPVQRRYCPECGQAAHVHRTLGAFWHDIAHSVLHFEGKIWRTLPMLAWRPGVLTRRYIAGERARFVSPMALFLFGVFLMFAVFSLVGGPVGVGSSDGPVEIGTDQDAERSKLVAQLAKLEADRAQAVADARATNALDVTIGGVRQEIAVLNAMNGRETAADGGAFAGDGESDLGWFNDAFKRAKENPSLLIYKLQNNGYKFSWALIPISVPFLWLLFLHRRRYRQYRIYDHTVFVTYSIAFMTLLAITLALLRGAGVEGGVLGLAFLIIAPLHMYRQLRGAYLLSRFSAAWRAVMLTQFAAFAASLFFLLLLTVGVLA